MAGWLKLDNGFAMHPKVVKAGRADTAWLYIAGLCYASANQTDGFIPAGVLAHVVGFQSHAHALKCARTLVDVGLWMSAKDGYLVHDYSEWQQTKSAINRKRRKDANRKKEARTLASRARTRRANVRVESERIPSGIREESARTYSSSSSSRSSSSSEEKKAMSAAPAEPVGRGEWFYAEWRRHMQVAAKVSLAVNPRAVDVPVIVEITDQVVDDGLLLDALRQFFTMSSERRAQLGIKFMTLPTFRTVLPRLLTPEPPAGTSRQTALNEEAFQRFVNRRSES